MTKIVWIPKAHVNYDYFSLHAVSESYSEHLSKIVGFVFNYKYENLDVFYDENDIKKHADTLSRSTRLVDTQLKIIRSLVRKFLEKSELYGKSNDIGSFNKWYASYLEYLPALGLVFGLELCLEAKLKEFLSEDEFHKVAFADETSAILENKSVLTLAGMEEGSKELEAAIDRQIQRFSWLGNKMMNYSPFTKEQIVERIKLARENYQKKLEELEENRKSLNSGFKEVESKLSAMQKREVRQYRELLYLRTLRADAICMAASITFGLFSNIAKRLGITRADMIKFSKDEINEMLKSGERMNIKEREMYHAEFIEGKFNVVFGSYGKEDKTDNETKEIKGIAACKGIAKGTAKIIIDMKDIKKVHKGDIIVAPYTNPNMLPAMEKAAGIVTEIGGMTSHAAIVSRELKKPCIIGAKNAAKVFKDGDLIELDANSGTARKLS